MRLVRSASTIAVMASTMTGVRKAMHASCLPGISREVICPEAKLKVFWLFPMLEVGLKATLKIIGLPFVIPPLIPPAPFLLGLTLV